MLCLGCSVTLTYAQQSLQDSHHTVLGYIKAGTITDANNAFLGNFTAAANGQVAISGKNHTVLGYLVAGKDLQGKEIQDANHKTLGYFKSDGKGTNSITVTNAQNKTLGYLNFENGSVMDNNHTLIGYEMNTEVEWAVPYFFFFKF